MPVEPTIRHRRLLTISLACLLSFIQPCTRAADVDASIDRSTLSLNESLQLTLESHGQPDSPPDLSVLEPDFEILGRRTSHNVSIVNGQRSERHILTLRLRPRHSGELRVPQIPIGDKTTESLPLTVTVAATAETYDRSLPDPIPTGSDASASATEVVLEADLAPHRGYAGQQFLLTAKVFTDGTLQGIRLQDPRIPNAEVLPLGEDSYQAERDDRSYRVYERRYAIFPREPGHLKVDPLLFEGWAPGTAGPGTGMGYPSQGRRIRAFSEPLTAQVLAVPEGGNKGSWLPARSLRLSEPGPAAYRTHIGQPIERRISLRAEGIIAGDLPELEVQVPYQISKQRRQPGLRDERRPDGVIGSREEIIVMEAREPGHYRLPAISQDWWNTTTGRWETAELPARDLVVSAQPLSTRRQPSPPGTTPGPSWQQTDQAEQASAAPLSPRGNRQDTAARPNGLWIWIAAGLALAWIATLAGWWRSRRRAAEAPPTPTFPATGVLPETQSPVFEEADPLQKQIDAVRAAYQSGNPGTARQALLAWAEQALPEQPPSNLARLAQRCPPPLRDQILLLEQAFFSREPVGWEEQPVWEGLKGFVPAAPEEPASFRRGKPIRRRAANPDAE